MGRTTGSVRCARLEQPLEQPCSTLPGSVVCSQWCQHAVVLQRPQKAASCDGEKHSISGTCKSKRDSPPSPHPHARLMKLHGRVTERAVAARGTWAPEESRRRALLLPSIACQFRFLPARLSLGKQPTAAPTLRVRPSTRKAVKLRSKFMGLLQASPPIDSHGISSCSRWAVCADFRPPFPRAVCGVRKPKMLGCSGSVPAPLYALDLQSGPLYTFNLELYSYI